MTIFIGSCEMGEWGLSYGLPGEGKILRLSLNYQNNFMVIAVFLLLAN
jgi:hypothetical protein